MKTMPQYFRVAVRVLPEETPALAHFMSRDRREASREFFSLIRERMPEFKKAAFVRVPIRLGEDVFTHGKIGTEKREKLIEAMVSFAGLMRVLDVKKFRACATSAMRDAANSEEIVAEILAKSGIDVEIISGDEEASLIFEATGAIEGLYLDVGGGSTELTLYARGERICSESFELGTVRILSGTADEREWERFEDWLRMIKTEYRPARIIGTGGNINKIHQMLSKRGGESLYCAELRDNYDEKRSDTLMSALRIFLTAARLCRIDEIVVPKVGLADGIIRRSLGF